MPLLNMKCCTTKCGDVASLAETIKARDMIAEYCSTDHHTADALTKVIQPIAWEGLLQLLSVRRAAQ